MRHSSDVRLYSDEPNPHLRNRTNREMEVRVERDELAVAERVLERVSEQLDDERPSAAPTSGQVGGRAVMLIPHRTSGMEEAALPSDYQRILTAVRQGAGPVMTRHVREMLGVDVSVRAKLEPFRGKLVRLADRGWLRKLPDGRFASRLQEGRQAVARASFT